MPVAVTRNAPGAPVLDKNRLRQQAEQMLACLELEAAELSVHLTNDKGIQRLNRQYRDKDQPTDVLSFEQDASVGGAGEPRLLGDVVISLETAARQAASRRRPLAEEARFLLAHGLLHLVGYDHANVADKRRMDALARRLVRATLTKSAAR